MFTIRDKEINDVFYYGKIIVTLKRFEQQVKLTLPIKEKLVILEGFDFQSHHRRVALSILREYTKNTLNEFQ